MKQMFRTMALLSFSILSLMGCGNSAELSYEAGNNHGYAAGYNKTCEIDMTGDIQTTGQIKITLVKADWQNKNYSRGYKDGRAEGARQCRRERQRPINDCYIKWQDGKPR